MKITINSIAMNLQENDEVGFQHHECGRCETTHLEVTVTRNKKEIAHFGEYVRLNDEDEVYGGVVLDENGNVLPDYHWVVHIIPRTLGMTEDRMYYIGLCGTVLDQKPENKHDRIAFSLTDVQPKERICPKCLEKYSKIKRR